MEVKDITQDHIGQIIKLQGWIKTNRKSSKVGFISFYDGSTINEFQIVYKDMPTLAKLNMGSAIEIIGQVVKSKGQQDVELLAQKILFVNKVASDYPIQKKEISKEFLREIPHLRNRTKFFSAMLKIRSELSFAIHKFYHQQGFVFFHSPIITSNDCEGAGESFIVTTKKNNSDFTKDFFKKKALLTVSGQLHTETAVQAVKKTYTFGPTFRSEQSHTSRHLAEFWMLEPEIAFADLKQITNNSENLIKFIIQYLLKNCNQELEYFQSVNDSKLISKLQFLVKSQFKYMTYSEIISILLQAIDKGHKFQDMKIEFGMDLGSEHEKYICDQVTKGPVFVTHYPLKIKAFYMKTLDDSNLVESFDLLVPSIGELIGGSVRENDYNKLINKAKNCGINIQDLQWYFDLRRFGSAPSAGFGLGFERLVMYVTGIKNIKDAIPFPRTSNSISW